MTEPIPPVVARRPSAIASLAGVVVRPAATFRNLAIWPQWAWPLAIVAGSLTVVTLASLPLLWLAAEEALGAAGVPPEMQPMVMVLTIGGMVVGAIVGPLFWAAVLTLVLWGWARVVDGGRAPIAVAAAAAVHVGVVVVLRTLVGNVLLVFEGVRHLVTMGLAPASQLGLAGLVDPGAVPGVAYAALAQVEVFTIWMAVVIGVAGVHALGMRKLSAAALAALVWFLNALLQLGGAALSSLGSQGTPISF